MNVASKKVDFSAKLPIYHNQRKLKRRFADPEPARAGGSFGRGVCESPFAFKPPNQTEFQMSPSPHCDSDKSKIFDIRLQDEIYEISSELLFLADVIPPWLAEVSGTSQEINLGLAKMLESLGNRLVKAADRVCENEQRQKV